jgi:hypothetical protein
VHTTTWWTSSVCSSATMHSPCGPVKPMWWIAAVASASSHSRYAGSVQARATTRAPFIGPTSFSSGR